MKLVFAILFCFSAIGASAQSFKVDSTAGVFGIVCGYAGSTPETMRKMVLLVNQNNRLELSKWITSKNPQSQLYGYVGLSILAANGIKLKQLEKFAMAQVSQSQAIVESCGGCFFEKRPLKEMIKTENLQYYYRWYMEVGQKLQ